MTVLLSIVIINALLGILVFTRNPRSRVNILFLVIVVFICLWTLSNYFTDHSPEHLRLFLDRSSFVFPVMLSGTLALLSRIFPVRLNVSRKIILYISAVTIFGVFISSNWLVVRSITIASDGTTNSVPGPLYNFYSFLVVVLLFGYAVRNYFISKRKADVIQRLQSSYVAYGFLISFFWALIVSVLLPIYVPKWNTAELGPDGTIVFVGAAAYAIVRHKLFDIRLIVARSLAYIFTLIAVALIFIIPIILLTTYTLHQPLTTASFVALIIAMFIVATIFHPLHNRYNKITNRLFFRDYYDPQEVIDQLSNILVGSVEVEHITNGSTRILNSSLRPQSVKFLFISDTNTNKDDQEILQLLKSSKDKELFVDEINNNHKKALHNSLHHKSIAAVIRLRTSREDLGYLLLGYKESGSIYNDVDKRLLGIAADEIAISLQNAFRFKEIKNFNKTLEQKIDEATEALHKANHRLKMLDDTKDDFIGMASHQLGTPLAVIKGYINLIVGGHTGKINKQQKDFLSKALVSSDKMVDLVSQLLSVSRITSGKFSVETKPVNLADMVDSEVEQLSNLAKERGVELTFNKPTNFPTLMLDEEKTRQVIGNFIDNAIHYARPKDAKIRVQLSAPDDIIFEVIDNGIGVPDKDKAHLFTKFYRANNAKDARPNGTGVGIYLAKVVINEQGGELIFQSKEGVGSTFGFRFKKDKIIGSGEKS